jgi:nucleotide-binding universal stress UspA family protein/hemerythrin-like domain-containing protein
VGNAVALASSLKARVSFFHAVPDHARSLRGDAELLRAVAPNEYTYSVQGKARELLAKAEAAARAYGVPCESFAVVSDKPAAAIVAAAHEHKCDLVVMASHGRRSKLGMALASETLSVLMSAGVPVLVTGVAEPAPAARAIGIVRDEHRSLAAVMHAWMHALVTAREQHLSPDTALMRAMVRYLHKFPLAVHHPKEEEHVFKRLRERTSTVDAELDELQRQHARDHELVAGLAQRVETLAAAPGGEAAHAAAATLESDVNAYASFLWGHMGREESVILPAAQRFLKPEDWVQIDAAFEQNLDPNFSGETEHDYRRLFSRIVNAAAGWH